MSERVSSRSSMPSFASRRHLSSQRRFFFHSALLVCEKENYATARAKLRRHLVLPRETNGARDKGDAGSGKGEGEVVDFGKRWIRRRWRGRAVKLLKRWWWWRDRGLSVAASALIARLPFPRLPVSPQHPSSFLQHILDTPDRHSEEVLRRVRVLRDEVEASGLGC
jgi:hypothetical protein